MPLTITSLKGLPEIRKGNDLAALIRQAAEAGQHSISSETIVVVAQKIVSKSEGAVVDLRTIDPSPAAADWARQWNKDPRLVEVILRQSRRIVKMDRGVLIVETEHGLVAANAGVDQSNLPGDDLACLLPDDPDASADRLRRGLGCGAVIVSDTFGRPWREGLVNVAIGVSGMAPLEDYRGKLDRDGRLLQGTLIATADELAAAAGLVMRKAAGVPVVLISGIEWTRADGSARELIRPKENDLFR
jgi:coenzyme F420-0:L-glutamate ligase / coenzyme F420-1:gamma-L-glutamate ligase